MHASQNQFPQAIPPLSGARNFRSLCGMPAIHGARIHSHALLRSDQLGRLTPQDWDSLGQLGLKTICDLRGRKERERSPTPLPEGMQVRLINFDIRNDVRDNPELAGRLAADPSPQGARELMLHIYRIFPAAFAPRLADWFGVFQQQQVPTLVHCAAGKDRTGFMVALLLHALGVHIDDVMQDYLLSAPTDGLNDPRIPGLQALFSDMVGLQLDARTIEPILQVEPAFLHAALSEIERQYGSIDGYLLKEGGVGPAAMADLRHMYLG